MGDVDHVGVRVQAWVLDRHGSQTRVVTGVPRARDGKDETTALSTVGTGLTETGTSITGVGDGRGGADVVSDLSVVVKHEVDLDGTLGRVDPVDSDLCTGLPEDVASVEVASWLVHDKLRVGVLVLSNLELGGGSSEGRSGEDGGGSQDLCERSHFGYARKKVR